MVSKCANPNCSAVFRYLREGRLFHFELRKSNSLRKGSVTQNVGGHECFWLCATCSVKMTLVKDNGYVSVRPLESVAARAGAISNVSPGRRAA